MMKPYKSNLSPVELCKLNQVHIYYNNPLCLTGNTSELYCVFLFEVIK